jgi:hypothetical protein
MSFSLCPSKENVDQSTARIVVIHEYYYFNREEQQETKL